MPSRYALLAATLFIAACESEITDDPAQMNIAVQVNGLDGSLALFNSGVGSFGVTGQGNYTVATRVAAGSAYNISVSRQPNGQTCVIRNPSGTAGTDRITVIVDCAASTFAVPVVASGFAGTLRLRLGNETLDVTAPGSASFAQPVTFGDAWQVAIDEEPVGHVCSISGSSGTVTGAIAPVQVDCTLVDPLLIRRVTVAPLASKVMLVSWQAVPTATHFRLLRDGDGVPGGAMPVIGQSTQNQAADTNVSAHLLETAIYVVEACNASRCVASEPVSINTLPAVGYLKGYRYLAGQKYGIATAISADGSHLFVSGRRGDANEVNVLLRSGSTFFRQKTFTGGTSFGLDIATSGQGHRLAVTDGGSVHLYRKASGIWNLETTLAIPLTGGLNWQAGAVALSGDGDTLAVGTGTVQGHPGQVVMYTRSEGIWVYKESLTAPLPVTGDSFGTSVALSHDGGTLAVGAEDERGTRTGVNADWSYYSGNAGDQYGAAYVLVRSGDTWAHQAYVKPTALLTGTRFGARVRLSSNGNVLAVAAPGDRNARAGIYKANNLQTKANSGAVYVYGRTGTAWGQNAYIKAAVVDAGDGFGEDISLSSDGRTLTVGAPQEDSGLPAAAPGAAANNTIQNSGAAYVFRKPASTWVQHRYIKSPVPDSFPAGEGDRFGYRLALSADASTLAVGAPGEDGAGAGSGLNTGNLFDESLPDSGAVFLY